MDKTPEFSFFIKCEILKEAEKTFHIEANNKEREKLAKRLDLLKLESLRVKAVVSRQSLDLVQAACECRAEYSQACVATSKPLNNNLNFEFRRSFSANAKVYFGSDVEPDEEEKFLGQEILDPPDPMTDGGFDLGESVAEQLSLEIDPFPRAADAVIDCFASAGEAASTLRPNPFAILEQLRKK
jgi:uncharacterized metal-binding protein YceD (DUF177 family)